MSKFCAPLQVCGLRPPAPFAAGPCHEPMGSCSPLLDPLHPSRHVMDCSSVSTAGCLGGACFGRQPALLGVSASSKGNSAHPLNFNLLASVFKGIVYCHLDLCRPVHSTRSLVTVPSRSCHPKHSPGYWRSADTASGAALCSLLSIPAQHHLNKQVPPPLCNTKPIPCAAPWSLIWLQLGPQCQHDHCLCAVWANVL